VRSSAGGTFKIAKIAGFYHSQIRPIKELGFNGAVNKMRRLFKIAA